MQMARKNNIYNMPMNHVDEYEVMAMTDGEFHFIRVGNAYRHFDLVGQFPSWEQADGLAKMIASYCGENLNYISMR